MFFLNFHLRFLALLRFLVGTYNYFFSELPIANVIFVFVVQLRTTEHASFVEISLGSTHIDYRFCS